MSLGITREDIVRESLTWVGTPWHHMQMCNQAGVDCVGLIGGVALTLGCLTKEQLRSVPYYSMQWFLHRSDEKLINTLLRLGFTEKPVEEKLPGDILGFQYGRAVAHSGIYLGGSKMIHAPVSPPKKVCINTIDTSRLKKVFVFPGVEGV